MLIKNQPINFQYNYPKKIERQAAPNFEARLPLHKNISLSDKKKVFGTLSATIAGVIAVFTNIYSNPENTKEPIKKDKVAELTGLDKSTISKYAANHYLERIQGAIKYNINEEQNKEVIKHVLCVTVGRDELAKVLGVNVKSINHHISKGHLVLNENNVIDLSHPKNRAFCENFSKGTRLTRNIKSEDVPKIIDETALKYFAKHGFIDVDDEGNINPKDDKTQKFLQKYKNKEISINDYRLKPVTFAKLVGRTPLTIKGAILNKEVVVDEDKKIDILHPKNAEYISKYKIDDSNPNLKTRKEIAEMLSFKYTASVRYYLDFNELVAEPNGLIDISKEPNKSFIERRLSGEDIKPVSRNGVTARRPKEEKEIKEPNYNIITQTRLGKLKNLSQATIRWHIAQGHLVLVDGKIDMSHPVNAYFLKNFKTGKDFVPYHAAINPMKYIFVSKPEAPKTKPKVKQANCTSAKGFSSIIDRSPTVIHYCAEDGKIVRNENRLFDLSAPINIDFMKIYLNNFRNKVKSMSAEELAESRENLKQYLSQYISRHQFALADDFIGNRKDYLGYISYLTRTIVNTENLSPKQLNKLEEIFEEYITSVVMSENFYEENPLRKQFILEGKCELYSYDTVLERLAELDK